MVREVDPTQLTQLAREHARLVIASGRSGLSELDLMCTFLDRRSVHITKRDFREALRSTT